MCKVMNSMPHYVQWPYSTLQERDKQLSQYILINAITVCAHGYQVADNTHSGKVQEAGSRIWTLERKSSITGLSKVMWYAKAE